MERLIDAGAFDNLMVETEDGSFPLIQLGQVLQKSPQLVVINLASSSQVRLCGSEATPVKYDLLKKIKRYGALSQSLFLM